MLQVKRLVIALSLAMALIGCILVHVAGHTHAHGRYEVVDAHGKPFAFCVSRSEAEANVLYWHNQGYQIVEVSPTSPWDK